MTKIYIRRKIDPSKSLLVKFPQIASEWHPTKNGNLTPDQVTYGSNKKAWWLCSKNSNHEYESVIWGRADGRGCPFCRKENHSNAVRKGRFKESNSLKVKYPKISEQWHLTKNGDLKPESISYASNLSAWWQCKKFKAHEWEARIQTRTRNGDNPSCAFCNIFETKFPEIAKEWHPTKNVDLKPEDVSYGSKKKVWWQCQKFAEHEWEATVNSRTNPTLQNNCPFCSGNRVSNENNFKLNFPEIAKEWHLTKNGDLNPEDVSYGSGLKVWWQCQKFAEHEWEATVSNRTTRDSACPKCTKQSSKPEIRIFTELLYLFYPEPRHKINKIEIDIYINKYKFGIEYDGSYWHKDKTTSDKKKKLNLMNFGVKIINIREFPLEAISKEDILLDNKGVTKEVMDRIINAIPIPKNDPVMSKVKIYLGKENFINDTVYNKYLNYFPSPFPENSLNVKFPQISKEWHFEKNYPLLPSNFSPGSNEKVWWQCPKFKEHEFQAVIISRAVQKTGCPFCAHRKISDLNRLSITNPGLASEWHPTKNGNLTPFDVAISSGIKAWWLCKRDIRHEWEATIGNRKNHSCPFCSGNKVNSNNSLLLNYPHLSGLWHPTKNGDLNPEDVSYGSKKKVWWQCQKFAEHEWQAKISSKTSSGDKAICSFCNGKKLSNFNNFKLNFPEIAKEWHPTKNGDLNPEDVSYGSKKKVWWQCQKFAEHEWQTGVKNRTTGKTNCPYCRNKKSFI